MKSLLIGSVTLVLLPCALPSAAQAVSAAEQAKGAQPRPLRGTVTGTAYCADTNLPARLAQIFLVPVGKDGPGRQSTAVSDLEGRFAVTHVPEGNYYIAAVLPGYLNELSYIAQSRFKAMSADERKELDAHVTTVVVSARQPAEASLRLERGAEIDGVVLYDDGSPGISLQLQIRQNPGSATQETREEQPIFGLASYMEQREQSTDDHGRFRILGLPPGEYLVSVTVPTASADPSGDNAWARMLESSPIGGLVVYAGGSLRASKARVIKVGSGEAVKDADITIPLSTLHSVHGTVVLKSTGQVPPAAAVQLIYADTQEVSRMAVAQNGEFELPYVPEDSFILRAVASAQPLPKMDFDDDDGDGIGVLAGAGGFITVGTDKGKFPGTVDFPLMVASDVNSLTLAVPDPPARNASAPSRTPAPTPDPEATQIVVPQ